MSHVSESWVCYGEARARADRRCFVADISMMKSACLVCGGIFGALSYRNPEENDGVSVGLGSSFERCPLGPAVCTSAHPADSIGDAAAEPVLAG